jgi:hypothetical protein
MLKFNQFIIEGTLPKDQSYLGKTLFYNKEEVDNIIRKYIKNNDISLPLDNTNTKFIKSIDSLLKELSTKEYFSQKSLADFNSFKKLIVSRLREVLAGDKHKNPKTNIIGDITFKKKYSENNKTYFKVIIPESIEADVLSKNIEIEIENKLNRTHMPKGIDSSLRGTGIGYSIYASLADYLGYITSDWTASDLAKNVWKKLSQDNNFYSIITDTSVIVISKSCEDIASVVKSFCDDKFCTKVNTSIDDRLFSLVPTLKDWYNNLIYNPDDSTTINRLIDKHSKEKIEKGDVVYNDKIDKIYTITYNGEIGIVGLENSSNKLTKLNSDNIHIIYKKGA